MEALLGVAGAGVGMLILFLLYLGSAGVVLRLIEGLRTRRAPRD
jgi:hypothetical protein